MYVSGMWDGFWQQEGWGRQPMKAFRLAFRGTAVSGSGTDVVGRFVVAGECDPATGAVVLVKQYLGKHKVVYRGGPDGEGCIGGEWTVSDDYFGREYVTRGPFLLRPQLPDPAGDEPIQEVEF